MRKATVLMVYTGGTQQLGLAQILNSYCGEKSICLAMHNSVVCPGWASAALRTTALAGAKTINPPFLAGT
jgi:hypothetical protein